MSVARSAGRRLLAPVFERAGSAYLVSPHRSTAISIAEQLVAGGNDVTLGYWPREGEPAHDVAAEEQATIGELRSHGPRATLAVKAPALGFQSDTVMSLARSAADAGVNLLFDAHAPEDADRTLALACRARSNGARVGVALPARWERSLADARVAAETGLSVRVVKGQWPDDVPGGGPAAEAPLRTAVLRLLDCLVEAAAPVSIATHDAVLLEAALVRLAAAGVPAEVELLLGLPVQRPLAVAALFRAHVRYYVAFGHPGLPYPFQAVLRRGRLTGLLAQGLLLGAHNQRIQQRAALGIGGRGQVVRLARRTIPMPRRSVAIPATTARTSRYVPRPSAKLVDE